MGVNPAGFMIGAVGCVALIIQGRRLKTDPNEEIRPIGAYLYQSGILFSVLLALVIILLIVDALGVLRWDG